MAIGALVAFRVWKLYYLIKQGNTKRLTSRTRYFGGYMGNIRASN